MYTATSYGYGEDFVMTPIKCPPPKIVAVKRSLKKKQSSSSKSDNGKIIDDENDSDVKDDFINEEEEEDAKDLIVFEQEEEPLIDLSDNPNSNESRSDDTIKDMNEKNSSTITMLLDLLEIGSIINSNNNMVCKKETENVESCAQENDYALLPSSTRRKSSSSSSSFPLESPGACALVDIGNTDKLSSIPSLPQPLTAIQPENPSIVKNSSVKGGKSVESAKNFNKKLGDSVNEPLHVALGGIDQLSIDFKRIQKLQNETSKNLQELQEKEKKSSSIFASSANILSVTQPSSKDSSHSCSKENLKTSLEDKEEKLKANDEHVTLPNSEGVTQDFAQEKFNSDSNNNNSIECNQNKLNFLSAHTSQRKLPPKFYSSTNSLNRSDCFEASSRLKRLEERFKGFSYTKKLLRSSKVFSKSEEILSSYGIDSEFNINEGVCRTSETLNSSLLDQFPLTTPSTFSENCLRQLIAKSEEECREDKKDYANISSSVQKFAPSSLNKNSGEFPSQCSLHVHMKLMCRYEKNERKFASHFHIFPSSHNYHQFNDEVLLFNNNHRHQCHMNFATHFNPYAH